MDIKPSRVNRPTTSNGFGPSITTADGRISTRDFVPPSRQRVVGAPAFERPMLPIQQRPATGGAITNFPARTPSVSQMPMPTFDMGIPAGEGLTYLPMPGVLQPNDELAAIRARAMQAYFDQLRSLGQ